tara:strand:+ start:515 stop:751 length:237 start_codon:yes stop_codon:yes gene_type:complete
MTAEWVKDVPNWEKDYLTMDPQLTKRQRALLEGDDIKSHEGMLFGTMYADWRRRKGVEPEIPVTSSKKIRHGNLDALD